MTRRGSQLSFRSDVRFAAAPWRSCIRWIVYWTLVTWVPSSVTVLAQRLADEENQLPYLPGVILECLEGNSPIGLRIVPQVSWQPDTVPAEGMMHVEWRWRGLLMSELDGPYRFHLYTNGAVEVRLNRMTLLKTAPGEFRWHSSSPVTLSFGWHPLEVILHASDPGVQMGLYWSGPNFSLEPVTERNLMHEPNGAEARWVERGRLLARALRCEACHGERSEDVQAAASLVELPGNIFPRWVVEWLMDRPPAHTNRAAETISPATSNPESNFNVPLDHYHGRRMPYYGLAADQAEALAAYLTAGLVPQADRDEVSVDEIENGRRLFLTVGCLACHGLNGLGDSGLFGGGDLSAIAEKRPASFFYRWLENPQQINPDHRMPFFSLSVEERRQIVAFLVRQGAPAPTQPAATTDSRFKEGKSLFEVLRCGACHRAHGARQPDQPLPALSAHSRWERSCAGSSGTSRQPLYGLSPNDQKALASYYSVPKQAMNVSKSADRLTDLLRQNNCVQCHLRGSLLGLAGRTTELLETFPELAPHVAALLPPALNAVGEKFHDESLRQAIRAVDRPRREWLLVRMPQYRLAQGALDGFVAAFIQADRIPDGAPATPPLIDESVPEAIAARLVTPDGFGCTSCHSVGKNRAPNAPIHTLGPNLAMLGQRIRRPWFERWVRNPGRIVPRIEMPAIQTPVPGVLDNQLQRQLAAVWNVLNLPEFRPPAPNPIRVVRAANQPELRERTVVITDVVQADGQQYVQALLFALPNRHNVLLDLGDLRLAGWWIGDAARQRTSGKTWFWEAGSSSLVVPNDPRPAWSLLLPDRETLEPERQGQFLTWFDAVEHTEQGVAISYRVRFVSKDRQRVMVLRVAEQIEPLWNKPQGFERRLVVNQIPDGCQLVFRPWQGSTRSVGHGEPGMALRWYLDEQRQIWFERSSSAGVLEHPDGSVILAPHEGRVDFLVRYRSSFPVDQFAPQAEPRRVRTREVLPMVPGFQAVRLPFTDEIMPTGLAWDSQGRLLISSLKGRIWRATDDNGDGWEDRIEPISDELAAPYGLTMRGEQLVVINKYALLGLSDKDGDGWIDRMETLAAGWGHTDDYHDWAVGLPEDGEGGYYIALPCQQDERPFEAALYRGMVLRLIPTDGAQETQWPFRIAPISAGHRFPMGLARNRHGWLFATDNQGNYNPFNELNHVRPGAHFGFINAWEKRAGVNPGPLTPPAINIPHPWTRSVNGIAFLETPMGRAGPARAFGPFEGHLIGCEYDTRRLIRMTIDAVGDVLQGGAYPFSLDALGDGRGFLGPVACAVSPQGHIYIGSLRDSGWGGGNNIGEVIRLVPDWQKLPVGIRQVRAVADGFELEFTGPINVQKASDPQSYAVSSYRRIPTPAYGGPDVDRRRERIAAIRVAPDERRVHLKFEQLRTGFVYEFHCKNLTNDSEKFFFPAEAYYTLHTVGPAIDW